MFNWSLLTWCLLHRGVVGRWLIILSHLGRISTHHTQLLGRNCSWRHLVALGTDVSRISKMLKELAVTLVLSLGIWTSSGGQNRLCASLTQLHILVRLYTYTRTISPLLMSLIESILNTRGRGCWHLDLLKGAIRSSLNHRARSVAWLLLVVVDEVVEVVRVHLSEVSWRL